VSTTGNVSVALRLSTGTSLFLKKQIVPVLMYGSPIWSIPKETNYMYLSSSNGLPKGNALRLHVKTLLGNFLNREVSVMLCRSLPGGENNNNGSRVLLEMGNYVDKEDLLLHHSKRDGVELSDWDMEPTEIQYEKCQSGFSKYTLNLSKYASTRACNAELGLFPLCNAAWSHAIKYYLRLENGTHNYLLNIAYQCCKTENYFWHQGIQKLLRRSGFSYVGINPKTVNKENFHHKFHLRLDDMNIQKYNTFIQSSSRFKLLSNLKSRYELSPYLTLIDSVEDRKIFTRLRLDMNVTKECLLKRQRGNTNDANGNNLCDLCKSEPEDVCHLLLQCNSFKDLRERYFSSFSTHMMRELDECNNDMDKVSMLLNLKMAGAHKKKTVELVVELYKERVRMSN
jgi:hypothetical protein